jgi:crotonobetainyl-CoA:carnitine CoA-transferase CaiB-like acyl-CoA transferase
MINERNRNKLGLTLDLSSTSGRELFLQLVNVSDLVIQNYSRRVMPSLGLGYETLAQRVVQPSCRSTRRTRRRC